MLKQYIVELKDDDVVKLVLLSKLLDLDCTELFSSCIQELYDINKEEVRNEILSRL